MIFRLKAMLNNHLIEYQLLIAIVFYNILDFVTTRIIIIQSGYNMEMEDNILLSSLMTRFDSVWVILAFKAFVLLIAWGIMYRYFNPLKHATIKPTLAVVLVAYIVVSFTNILFLVTR